PLLFVACIAACSNDKTETSKTTDADTSTAEPAAAPDLPSYVLYKNWETGKPENTQLVLNVYKAWDSDNAADMASYFADSASYDFPDGTRSSTTNQTM